MDHQETEYENSDLIDKSRDWDQWRGFFFR